MKLIVEGIRCGDCVRAITAAILRLDLGARINIDEADKLVGIAGRVSLRDAARAIEDGGFRVAAVADETLVDAVWPRTGRPAPAAWC